MHSASLAARAIVQLCMSISTTEEIQRRISAFSVAYNKEERVKIFGHFALVTGKTIRPICSANFVADVAASR
jgi:hypothetical protein